MRCNNTPPAVFQPSGGLLSQCRCQRPVPPGHVCERAVSQFCRADESSEPSRTKLHMSKNTPAVFLRNDMFLWCSASSFLARTSLNRMRTSTRRERSIAADRALQTGFPNALVRPCPCQSFLPIVQSLMRKGALALSTTASAPSPGHPGRQL